MIHLESLHFGYPASAFRLDIPSFSVDRLETVAVIGPSGVGKTTLLNLVSGILVADQGRVRVAGVEVSALSDAARRDFRIGHIGFIFQDFGLLDYLNVLDNILHPYRISRALKLDRQVRQRALDLAAQMAIDDKLRRHPGELSHGERQRVAICRALLPQPLLILADEATGNLDPTNKTRILDLLFESVADHNATLLGVTHDHELLSRFDRIVDFGAFSTC